MSKELEQMRQLTAAHDDPQSSIHGNIITTEVADGSFVKFIVDFRGILARMESLEKVVVAVTAILDRFSSYPMMGGTLHYAGFNAGMLGGSSIHDDLTAMDRAFAAIRKS